ncbi:helix-turn-helix transcriptional regulator [Streptomyces spectabilis]|uniref:DNA-binding NarL/FixJ family response regulator n=1 Tax=Streptomyces spectabilis TaxID=68270 RepID=A0A5P2XEE4_STRST|nr:LuxR C-terminal-related transcriptional regulator [Streptomyces spectabilis]MBB5105201.1 DNA-binding NarL/FixJ family response regulator [Streptomyces spectabilis]MCI3905926.1 LuxR C-terminal-related transcriptional regulator [Streptomyces spectabilis]QEV62838.1 DNA-binding response regulator [Streptomyces spectabilis]GGV05841.1 helix-turn-helix transcriptional regulator [Streptomyces spectabilis]
MTAAGAGEAGDVRAALVRLRRTTGLPVAFGGLTDAQPHAAPQLRIAELTGTGTHVLRGLGIRLGNGLGGKALALARPCAVTDYSSSRHISHEYDAAVEAEGLRSVLAVPVVVRRRVRGLLYGALRTAQPLGDRTLAAAVAAARDVEQALVVREEARALVAAARDTAPAGPWPGPAAWERVREAHGALRALAARTSDAALRRELLAVCTTLTAVGDSPAVALTPRELDVLTCVALGTTNAAAGERLGLRPETVKAYLRSAMRKLGVHTRWEAVVAARRAGLLP